VVQLDRPHIDSITRNMRIACWIPKATNIHSEYVILILCLFRCNNGYTNAPEVLRPSDIFCVILNGEELQHVFEAVGPYVRLLSRIVAKMWVCLPADRLIRFHLQTAEKGLDLSELWRSRQSSSAAKKNDAAPTPVAPSVPQGSSFKRWRRSYGTRNGGGRSSTGHAENCNSKESAGVEDRSLLKFLALVSGRDIRLEVMYPGTLLFIQVICYC